MNYEEISKWSDIVSALLFMGVLVWLWVKFIAPAVFAAQENSNRQIAEAERHRDEAKAALEALRSEIESAKHDAQLIAARASDQAQRESETQLREAREAGERVLRNAGGELDRARAQARETLRDELAEKALTSARARARQLVDSRMNSELAQRFVADLKRDTAEAGAVSN